MLSIRALFQVSTQVHALSKTEGLTHPGSRSGFQYGLCICSPTVYWCITLQYGSRSVLKVLKSEVLLKLAFAILAEADEFILQIPSYKTAPLIGDNLQSIELW